ncbi:MAG: ADOP family duplicated permease [Candidatus Acidiferrales bacterium]
MLFRLRALFHRKEVESELDDELRFHFEQQVEKSIAAGLTREEANCRARLVVGGAEQLKEECREARGVNFLETLLQDIRYALRILGRTPAITAIAILSLALGIGANTAVFSLIDTVMLRLLPVQKPEELVQLFRTSPQADSLHTSSFTNALWEQTRDHQDVFTCAFAWSQTQFDLAQGGAVRNANGIFASGNYFSTLGVRPAGGRLFVLEDDRRGCPGVAVLSYGFWQDHFGGAQSAIGGTLSLNHLPFQIIGVSAPGFYGMEPGQKIDVAIPICSAARFDRKESRLDHRDWWWLSIAGRVKPGVSREQLSTRLGVLSPQVFGGAVPQDWAPADQESFVKRRLLSEPAATGTSDLRQQFGQPLTILMVVVGLVLLIACPNIASLMFARGVARSKEMAVRKALGASRMRLIRQLLTECILLSSAGALLGILFARWGSALLVRFISTTHNSVYLDLSLDGRVLAFTATVAVLTGILFGLLPAFRSTRVSLTSAMKGAGAEDNERHVCFRPGKWIVGSQVAMSLILLVVAGLFLRSIVKLVTLDIGFDRTNVLIVNTNLKTANIPEEQWPATYEDVENRLRSLPGVISVSRSIMTPISNFEWNNYIKADTPNAPTGDASLAYFNFISPGYFDTLRTPLLAGRGFNANDTKSSPQVAIVNETLARKFFSTANPVGKSFRVAADPGKPEPLVQIVGLVKDAKYESLREDTYATSFFPITQIPEGDPSDDFELRTAIPPSGLTVAVQDEVAKVNKSIPLEMHTLAQQVDDSLVQERLLATLSVFFGALALLLAAIGLYGALSYLVNQRRIEFGIRMALGARPVSILQLVLRDLVAALTGGVAAGVAISLAAVGVLQKLLFGLAPRDSLTMIGAACLLAAVAFLAAYLPARRAMRADPMTALRYE